MNSSFQFKGITGYYGLELLGGPRFVPGLKVCERQSGLQASPCPDHSGVGHGWCKGPCWSLFLVRMHGDVLLSVSLIFY